LAKVQTNYGVIPSLSNIVADKIENVDVEKSLEMEKVTKHDLAAELKIFSEQCGESGKYLHNGATSMDIKDNADIILTKDSLIIIKNKLKILIDEISNIIIKNKEIKCMGYTHLQPAEPTTIGYRFANYLDDLTQDYNKISYLSLNIKTKGFKGSVGTGSPYVDILGKEKYNSFLSDLQKEIGIKFFDTSTQTYTRKQDYEMLVMLSSLGMTIYKIAFDLRILQSYPYGEILEDFSENQVGSSAMPFKRNPITAEKICSLSRELPSFANIAWENGANSILERTLDDSANRRNIIPEAFLISDEIIVSLTNLLKNITFNYERIEENYQKYISFSITDSLMSSIVLKTGADRQEIYKIFQELSFESFNTEKNLIDLLISDKRVKKYINKEEILKIKNNLEYAVQQSEFAVIKAKLIF